MGVLRSQLTSNGWTKLSEQVSKLNNLNDVDTLQETMSKLDHFPQSSANSREILY